MAERNHDDIAAALQGLSSGQGSEPAAPHTAVPKRPASPVARPTNPVAPAAAPAARSAVPRSTPASPTAPQQRVRPATPARPATPEAATAPESLDYRAPQTAAPKPKRRTSPAAAASLRRTMIPILLTTGVMLFVMAAARWMVPEDAALAQMPAWSAGVLIVLGVVMLGLAAINMMAVRHDEHRRQLQSTSGAAASR